MQHKPKYLREAEQRLNCPCCGKNVAASSASATVGRKYWSWGITTRITIENILTENFSWACDNCISKKRAIIALPDKQLYCDHNPYFAYFDREEKCRSCRSKFVFTASEQQYWYETLRFWVQSVPARCLSCRKQIRKARNLNTTLSSLLRDGIKNDVEWLQRVAAIYRAIGKNDKAQKFERMLSKATAK